MHKITTSGLLFWGLAIGVEFSQPLIATVAQNLSVRMNLHPISFPQVKVMTAALGVSGADDLACRGVDHQLRLERMPFFLTTIKLFLASSRTLNRRLSDIHHSGLRYLTQAP